MLRSAERQKGYDEGYKQALLDVAALRQSNPVNRKMGGPDSPYKPRGIPGSIYNDD